MMNIVCARRAGVQVDCVERAFRSWKGCSFQWFGGTSKTPRAASGV